MESAVPNNRVKGLKRIPPGIFPGIFYPFPDVRSFLYFWEVTMKKLIAMITLAAMMLTGCASHAGITATDTDSSASSTSDPAASAQASSDAAAPELTFTDDLGREVTLSAAPTRVACLLGSYADIWSLAGGTSIAAPDDAWDDYKLDMPANAVNLGGTKHLSLEAIVAAEPDFILASSNSKSHLEWQSTLESSGIPVAYFNVTGFEDYLNMLKICTDLLGTPENYEIYGAAVQGQIDEAISHSAARLETSAPPKILHMRIAASGMTVKNSKGNILGEIAADLGCINIADSDTTLLENLSMEHILVQDPDYILLVQQGDDTEAAQAALDQFIQENPTWQELSAVKNDRVLLLDKHLFSLKPNALWGESYEKLEQILSEAK